MPHEIQIDYRDEESPRVCGVRDLIEQSATFPKSMLDSARVLTEHSTNGEPLFLTLECSNDS